MADVKEFRYAALEDLTGGCLVAADQVTDPRNLGALVRSAEALGASGLILPAHRTARVTAVVEKAAAGATSSLPIAIVGNLAGALERLKRWDYWVVGLDAGAEIAIQDFEFPQKIVLVVGSEGEGMRYRTRALCDFRVAIPLTGRVTSLNVSVAGAIAVFCHHTYRQRIDSSPPGDRRPYLQSARGSLPIARRATAFTAGKNDGSIQYFLRSDNDRRQVIIWVRGPGY